MAAFLSHPFDDELFAAIAGARGIGRAALPDRFEPGEEWGNDASTTDLPGMPRFSFMAGDAGWHGVMAIYLDACDYRRADPRVAGLTIPMVLCETQRSALRGRTCADVVALAGIDHWEIEGARDDPDDPDATIVVLRVPRAKPLGRGGRAS